MWDCHRTTTHLITIADVPSSGDDEDGEDVAEDTGESKPRHTEPLGREWGGFLETLLQVAGLLCRDFGMDSGGKGSQSTVRVQPGQGLRLLPRSR